MKIYVKKIDFTRLNCATDDGRYSLKKEGEFTEAIKMKHLGDTSGGDLYGVFYCADFRKVFILDRWAQTFRQFDGWAPVNV